MNNKINDQIEEIIKNQIVNTSLVGGGYISRTERLMMKSGLSFFLKSGRPDKLNCFC